MIILKLQLDTTRKTIKIDENVKLTKLMSLLKKLLPNGEWMDFTLETNTTITQWYQPYYFTWRQPIYPWFSTPTYTNATIGSNTITGQLNSSVNTLNPGVYNIEVK